MSGSSPRVRGKPPPRDTPHTHGGLIPACAGKTEGYCSSWSPWSAHPRVCGENAVRTDRPLIETGSSPRVRGKPGPGPRFRGAHPRVCGENLSGGARAAGRGGSSPRVRGKLLELGAQDRAHGLIPACAGKTLRGPSWPAALRAHPRVCGENSWIWSWQRVTGGSSPRVRGKHELLRCLGDTRRLIPACAGKTVSNAADTKATAAHPRVCGENAGDPGHARVLGGSSPRVRGKRRASR